MANRMASVVFVGSDAQLNATLARIEGKLKALSATAESENAKIAASSDAAGLRIGTAFDHASTRAGSALTRIGQSGQAMGIPLAGSLTKIGAHFDEATSKGEKLTAVLSGMGKLTLGAGFAGFGVAAAVGVKGAMDLQTQMLKIHTQAGASTTEVNKMTAAVVGMAGSVGTGPQKLAESLFHVESVGLRGAKALQVLRTAAEGAQVGGANLVDVQNALDAAVVSGIKGVSDYKQAMGQLNATVGAGDMTMQDLADALGTGMLATAKTFGVSIKSVGAALATFGDNNIRGAEAATKLQRVMLLMGAPSKEAAKALHAVGISQLQLNEDMRSGGLIKALMDLKQHLTDSGATASQQAEIISRAFGGSKSAGSVMLLLSQLSRVEQKQKDISEGGNKFGAAWQDRTHQLSFQFDQLKATLQAAADKLGLILIPVLQKLGNVLSDGINWLTKHKAAAEALAVAIGSVLGLAVAVFAEQKAVAFARSLGRMTGDLETFANWLLGNAGTVESNLGGIGTAGKTAGAEVGTGMATAKTAVAGAEAPLASAAAADGAAITDGFAVESAVAGKTAAAMTAAEGAVRAAEPVLATEGATAGSAIGKGILSGVARIFTAGAILAITAEALKGPLNQLDQMISRATGGVLGGGVQGQTSMTRAQAIAYAAKHYPNWDRASVIAALKAAPASDFGVPGANAVVPSTNPGYQSQDTPLGVNQSMLPVGVTISGGPHPHLVTQTAAGTAAIASGTAAMLGTAQALVGTSYTWGGGHNGWDTIAELKKIGVDCSGFVSQVLHAGGVPLPSPMTTGGLASFLRPGQAPGNGVTVWDKTTGSANQQHVIINIAGHWFESGGVSGGVGQMTAAQAQSMISSGGFNPYEYTGPAGGPGGIPESNALQQYLASQQPGSSSSSSSSTRKSHETPAQTAAGRATALAGRIRALIERYTSAGATARGLGEFGQVAADAQTVRELDTVLAKYVPEMRRALTSPERATITAAVDQQIARITGTTSTDVRLSGRATSLTTSLGNAAQNGSIRSLENLLGYSSRTGNLGGPQQSAYTSLVHGLAGSGSPELRRQSEMLVAAHKQALDTLRKELVAHQDIKQAEMLQLQATQMRDRTSAENSMTQATLAVVKSTYARINDAMAAAATQLKDAGQSIQDRFAAIVTAIQDATQSMADTSAGIVAGIQDQTAIKVDILGERGLYGLNLIAQQDQVAYDQARAFYDQQISVAQGSYDSLKATFDVQIAQAQAAVDSVTTQQDMLVGQAQQTMDTVQLRGDTKMLGAQQHQDTVMAATNITVQIAQTAVDMSANASKAVQDATNATLKKADGNQAKSEAAAAQHTADVTRTVAYTTAEATNAYTVAQNNAAMAITGAQNGLATIQGQANQALAVAAQDLQSLNDTAAEQEARLQGIQQTTQAMANTQWAGSGLNVHIYSGGLLTEPTAIAEALSWVGRTQFQLPVAV